MPRPNSAVPSYKLHKPSGQAVMRVILPGGTRKSVYLGVFGSPESKAEYARRVQAIGTNSTPTAIAPNAADITVAELLVKFREHTERHYRHPDGKPTSEIWSFRLVTKPLKELFAYLPANEFGPSALKTLRSKMIELEWCRKTVNKSVTRVRSIFKWGVSEELVPAELLARLHARALHLKGKELDAVLAVCDGNGSVPLAQLGLRFEWDHPQSHWNAMRGRLNRKFKRTEWRFSTFNGEARVQQRKPGERK